MNGPFRDLLASDYSDERRSIIDLIFYIVNLRLDFVSDH